MFKFNEYIENKHLAEKKQEVYVREEKKLKALEMETRESGWETLEHKPELVNEYVKYITRYSK